MERQECPECHASIVLRGRAPGPSTIARGGLPEDAEIVECVNGHIFCVEAEELRPVRMS
ncbi:hypothetical protein [Baekduia soli]|uniref:hypothetical protein n=1 Tax=Baekduia soli TaxID=496014 RepID=UPI001651EC37|nr:hypothetical protein [Baekduia soli]